MRSSFSVAWGWVSADAVKGVLALMDRELAILWRLEHPKKKERETIT
jgi:hypothetical protein